ncbi:MAG TPA: hypothetical protein VFG14_13885, partial [Chthoniobacteraceae bacterium]|nr:hypothetical protein [Chthoniobacteraceae bacterium]
MKQSSLFCRAAAVLAAALALIVTTGSLLAGAPAAPVSESSAEARSESWFSEWWNGKYMTGNWFGLRDTLEDYGFKFAGKYEG